MTSTAEDGNPVPLDQNFGPRVSFPEEVGPGVKTIAQAITRMEAITAAAPEGDGLRSFNQLYTLITQTVDDWLVRKEFADSKFLRGLDIAFANRYFSALREWGKGRPDNVPRVWRVLLERRSDPMIAPIQFAVAGVNAHINFDLAPALVKTCETIKAPLGHGYQRPDYELINEIFAQKYKILRDELTDGLVDRLDEKWRARALDYASNFVVTKARDEAWESAERIVVHRQNGDQASADRVLDRLDRHFGLVAHGLLVRGMF